MSFPTGTGAYPAPPQTADQMRERLLEVFGDPEHRSRVSWRGLLGVFALDQHALLDSVLDQTLPQPWLGLAQEVVPQAALSTRAMIRLEQAMLSFMRGPR